MSLVLDSLVLISGGVSGAEYIKIEPPSPLKLPLLKVLHKLQTKSTFVDKDHNFVFLAIKYQFSNNVNHIFLKTPKNGNL